MRLLAEIAAHLVEYLLEHRQQRIDIGFRDDVGLLVDVEQDRLRRDRHRLAQGAGQHRFVLQLFSEEVERLHAIDLAVLQEEGQHLQKVGFARAEEARDPDAVGGAVIVVGLKELLQPLADFACDDIFVEFDTEAGLIVGLDDAVNRTIYGLEKNVAQRLGHRSNLVVQDIESTVIFVVMKPPEEVERGARRQGMGIAAGEEQHGRLVFGGALQVVQHVVRANVGVNLAHPRQENHVVWGGFDCLADFWDQVGLRVQNGLQKFADLVFSRVGLDVEDLVQNATFFQDRYRQVVKTQVQYADTRMANARHKIGPILVHGQPFLCGIGADEEWHLVSEALLGQEPLARHDLEKVFGTFLAAIGRAQNLSPALARPGKIKIS